MQIKIEKKKDILVLALTLVIILGLLGITAVYAFGGNQPAVMGHSGGEVQITIGSETKNLQDAINDGNLTEELSCRVVEVTDTTSPKQMQCNTDEIATGWAASTASGGALSSVGAKWDNIRAITLITSTASIKKQIMCCKVA